MNPRKFQALDPKPTDKAFTLIELLVVIAIIAILAGLLMSVIGQAKDKAYSAQCINHLRQIGLGIMSYADDNQGAIPSNVTVGSPGTFTLSSSLGIRSAGGGKRSWPPCSCIYQ
jgi:prepilin-type N-terminal cleavage/methylation domain-containing protein